MPRKKTVHLVSSEKTRKYLTEIEDMQRKWIQQAAKELAVTQPTIIQLSLMRMMKKEWPTIKTEWQQDKAKERLEALQKEHRQREREINELRAIVQPTERPSVEVSS